ncbi:MAG TPA: hypothetical protein VII99_12920 [Bacteroidia bacterium]
MKQIRHYENLHIPLWLMKDTCWLMQWKLLGMIMIAPTIGMAIFITLLNWKSKDEEFWINFAICFWIAANAYWMCCEFVKHEEYKFYSAIPFAIGFICVAVFYGKKIFGKKANSLEDFL